MTDLPGRTRPDPLQGKLEMLILRTLSVESLHGYAIAQHIERLSDGVFRVDHGSLYPALERLLGRGWVTSEWGRSPTGRRARYYMITDAGRTQLGEEISSYDRVAQAVARVLGRA